MKLTSTQKMLAAGIGIALAALAVVVLLILPQFGVMSSLDAEAEAARQQQQQARVTLAQLEAAKQNASATQAELLRIGTQLPESPQLPTLIIEIQDLSNASGVGLSRLSPAQPASIAGAGYAEVGLEAQYISNWADLLDHLRRLNGSTRFLRVTDISIADVETADEKILNRNNITTTVKIKAYVYDGGGTAGTPSAPTP